MDYAKPLKYHFRPARGWINDPNGLIYYDGYYHIFYQHIPDREKPTKAMHWGHAKTKNFIDWEELPPALYPDKPYDAKGCWSGTAFAKDGVLYLFYASLDAETQAQTISVAYSKDGINFEKYENNPVIDKYPPEGSENFRDPAVWEWKGKYYCAVASGNDEEKKARILLYSSDDLLHWEYKSVMCEWENGRFTECPSVIADGDKLLVAVSVAPIGQHAYFQVMYGSFENEVFTAECSGCFDKGPDQYAGQMFRDHLGRNLLIAWAPGWDYMEFPEKHLGYEKNIGCMTVPREIKIENGIVKGCPVSEFKDLLKSDDEYLKLTETGFEIQRTDRAPAVYSGKVESLEIVRDECYLEVFVNGGEAVYTVLL